MKKRVLGIILALSASISMASVPGLTASAAETLPGKVDLRDFNGKNYVTPPKLQNPFGTCWAFGAAGAAETSYLFANNLGVTAGEKNNNVNFSEKGIVWFLYHSITADDVVKGKVRSSQIGEGNDLEEADKEYINACYNFGGSGVNTFNFFASGFGPVDESVEVNGDYPYSYNGKNKLRSNTDSGYSSDDNWSIPVNAQYRSNSTANAALRSCNLLPSPSTRDAQDNYVFSEENLNVMKSELAHGRAITIGTAFEDYLRRDTWSMYNCKTLSANHEVTIVGYDDSYPKENFTRYFKSGKEVKGTTPPADGAFIVKNWQGSLTEEDKATAKPSANGGEIYENPNAGKWGINDSGYFYLSYYDQSIESPASFEFDSNDSVKYTSPNYDQYNLLMSGVYDSVNHDTETKMANVFDAEEDEYLYRIAYYTNEPNAAADYKIYRNVKGGDPESGVLLEQGSTNHEFGGYHNVDLKGEYFIRENETYSVVLTIHYTNNGKKVFNDVVPFAFNIFDGMHKTEVKGIVNEGESYFYNGENWNDLADIKEDIIDRVYENTKNYTGSLKKMIDMNPDGKSGISIDNYPIKALLAPASAHVDRAVIGDVNGDGAVTIDDATKIQKFLAKSVTLTAEQQKSADTNGDGTVSVNDVTCIQKYLAGNTSGTGKTGEAI